MKTIINYLLFFIVALYILGNYWNIGLLLNYYRNKSKLFFVKCKFHLNEEDGAFIADNPKIFKKEYREYLVCHPYTTSLLIILDNENDSKYSFKSIDRFFKPDHSLCSKSRSSRFSLGMFWIDKELVLSKTPVKLGFKWNVGFYLYN